MASFNDTLKLAAAGGLLLGLAAGACSSRKTARNGKRMERVVFGSGETGWAENLGDGLWRIANVPFDAPLNADDVVELMARDGRLEVVRVRRRVFPRKSVVRYEPKDERTFRKLDKAFQDAGWKLEGALPGVAVLAHELWPSPEVVAHGIEIDVKRAKLGRVVS